MYMCIACMCVPCYVVLCACVCTCGDVCAVHCAHLHCMRVCLVCAWFCMHAPACVCVRVRPFYVRRAALFPTRGQAFENTEWSSPSGANTARVGLAVLLARQGAVCVLGCAPSLSEPAVLGPPRTTGRRAARRLRRLCSETPGGENGPRCAPQPGAPHGPRQAPRRGKNATSPRATGASRFVAATFCASLLTVSDAAALTPRPRRAFAFAPDSSALVRGRSEHSGKARGWASGRPRPLPAPPAAAADEGVASRLSLVPGRGGGSPPCAPSRAPVGCWAEI